MAPEPNGRFDYLHQEMQQLRSEMREGFRDVRGDVAALRSEVMTEVDDNARRIGKLEQWRSQVKGTIAGVSSASAVVGAGLTLAVQWIRGR